MYYDNASVGHNKLGTFMTEISRMAKLSHEYTNVFSLIVSDINFLFFSHVFPEYVFRLDSDLCPVTLIICLLGT
jgi:hypothetical protein